MYPNVPQNSTVEVFEVKLRCGGLSLNISANKAQSFGCFAQAHHQWGHDMRKQGSQHWKIIIFPDLTKNI